MVAFAGFTDFSEPCGVISQTFYQMLARCIVLDDGHYKLNIITGLADCDDLHPFWTCDNSHLDPEKALVDNVFAYDECGHLALKMMGNEGLEWRGGDVL
jgi:hypothetical protein